MKYPKVCLLVTALFIVTGCGSESGSAATELVNDAETDIDAGVGSGVDDDVDAGVGSGVDDDVDAGVGSGVDDDVDPEVGSGVDEDADSGADTDTSEQGHRAAWLRGAWGALWLPEKTYNGNIEGVTIDEFIEQIAGVRTLDYVQLPLTSPNIYSPTHTAPHDIIEGLWQGDTDDNGDPINLVVPRSTADDPFLSWLLALRAAGLKSEIYVNSYNLLARYEDSIPDGYPNVSERWMAWCDTNTEAQTFLNSQSYYGNDDETRRKYMFCYAEFILKEYAVRYGDLIDAWVFDSADNIMEDEGGDDPSSESVEDQRIYEAFASAVHAGNPNAAVAFNNSVGTAAKPFATPTLFDDYTFGHPFGGAGDMVETDSLYTRNFYITELMGETGGLPFLEDNRDWNDNVVGHFFPKQSTTSWNGGKTACLTDDEFVEWTATGIIDGGAITWGTPLVTNNLENKAPNLVLWDYALAQLLLADAHLKEFQEPGKPNWARQYTSLPVAVVGEAYSHTLTVGVDFWDPEGDEINQVYIVDTDTAPNWLVINETATGIWTLSGTPTETSSTDYSFRLRVKGISGGTNRNVELSVKAL
ncbi:putative Ig domain-containing protein [Psychromonas sp.]|nr:putative Ig domain-containing protein [Psychromonas sp.]